MQKAHTIVTNPKFSIPPDITEIPSPTSKDESKPHQTKINPITQQIPVKKIVKWKFFEFDATKLHKYCLMLSKARLSCKYNLLSIKGDRNLRKI